MVKNPKFFKNLLNMSVENVHPLIVFKGEKHYYFMALKSYKEKYENYLFEYNKIVLKGQGVGFQMTKNRLVDNDVIYKVEKSLLEKNVFSTKKTKVKIINNNEIEQIFNDFSRRLLTVPPELALAEITLINKRETQTKVIYAKNNIFNQYKKAYEIQENSSKAYIKKLSFMYRQNQISNAFIHDPDIKKLRVFKELEDLKTVLTKSIEAIKHSKLSINLSNVNQEKLKNKITLGTLKEQANGLEM